MSEVLPGTDLKCEEITMAVHRMQNLQLLSNTGQKRCEYKAGCIWTRHVLPCRPGGWSLPVDPWGFVTSYSDLLPPPPNLVFNWPYFFPKDFERWKGVVCIQQGHPVHWSFCSLSGRDALLWFMRSGLSHGMLQPAAFKNAKRWGVYTVWLLRLPLGCHFKAPSSTDGRTGLSLSRQTRRRWLIRSFACISSDFSTSLGRFAISGLQYWPHSKACNDGVRASVGRLADDSYKSRGLVQQVDKKSILQGSELIQCFSYRFPLYFTCWVIDRHCAWLGLSPAVASKGDVGKKPPTVCPVNW